MNKARKKLDRDSITTVALQIIDNEGHNGLTMRNLAKSLDVEAMSLYNHVKNKRDLHRAIIDRVVGSVVLPEADLEWKIWVREWMLNLCRACMNHPNLFPILLEDPPLGPKILNLIDALIGRLNDAGFATEMQYRLWGIFKAFLFGNMIQQNIDPGEIPAAQWLNCCSNIDRLLPSAACCTAQENFEFGLQVMMAGMEKMLEQPEEDDLNRPEQR